ncbi:MAG: aldo/keto reductase, partial [Candidatus Nanopelagicus sp.]
MEYRKLGGLSISRLGLGTMTWGRDTDENEAAQQLQYFVEAGGNFVDTAAVYGDGDSERVLGGFIGTLVKRDQILIASK